MNDEHVRALSSFVQLHASKLARKAGGSERCAYLVPYRSTGIPLDVRLEEHAYTQELVVGAFDAHSAPVRWVLRQMSSYDQDTECVVGLVFDRATVFAHVIRRGTRM